MKQEINSMSLITDEYIFDFYNKLNEIGNNKKYPYNLLEMEEDGFIPTYKNIELKLVDPKLFLIKKGGRSNVLLQRNDSVQESNLLQNKKEGKVNVLLF